MNSATSMNRRKLSVRIRQHGSLYLFLVPAVAVVALFQYLPMFSNYMAFLDYDFNAGWMGFASPFVGLKNFDFIADPFFLNILWRTIYYGLAMLFLSFPAPLILALLMNELFYKRFMKFVQTVSYIPHFVSWVTVAGLFYIFLSTDVTGLVNTVRGSLTGAAPYPFMQDANFFLPLLIISHVWKEMGWGTILYFAALTNIDPSLYEAAQIDGAGRWQQMWNITLPCLIPTTCILLIFNLGGLVTANFDQIFNMQNDMIRNLTDTINVHVYYRGVIRRQYSYAAAVGLFQGIVSFVLIMSTNYVTKRIGDTGII